MLRLHGKLNHQKLCILVVNENSIDCYLKQKKIYQSQDMLFVAYA